MLSETQEDDLHEMMIRKRAEKLRLQAVHLASEYGKLCRRDPSPGIVEDDSKAVIEAWARLP